MEAITDILSRKDTIERSIKAHGFFAEHNFWHFYYKGHGNGKSIFLSSGNDMGVMAYRTRSGVWHLLAEVLAPEKSRLRLFMQFLRYAYEEGSASKVTVEVTGPFRQRLLEHIRKSSEYRIPKYHWVLKWPLFNMRSWDSSLSGKAWKKTRNIINRLHRKHDISIRPASGFKKSELRSVVSRWVKRRRDNDQVDSKYYMNIIDNNFRGFDITRVVAIDNKPCAITGGWKVPNTNNYYSSLGLLDYSYPGIGELANVDDLQHLKKKGFSFVDFGGSFGSLTDFKKKFMPERYYETYGFSVLRN